MLLNFGQVLELFWQFWASSARKSEEVVEASIFFFYLQQHTADIEEVFL